MDCGEVTEALSALLDGEASAIPAESVQRHLASCRGCRQWQARAEQLNRLVRVQAAAVVPDLTEHVLTAVHRDPEAGRIGGRPASVTEAPRRPARQPVPLNTGRRAALRIALAFTAVTQLAIAVPDLLSDVGHGAHTGREGAAFDLAIAVGFLVAARYPNRARALVPVAVVLAAALAFTTATDLALGATTLVGELGHSLAVVQAGLLWVLSRRGGRTGRGSRPVRPVPA